MDVYGLSTPDGFGIDDLLDFSNDEIFTSSTSTSTTVTTTDSDGVHRHHFPYSDKNSGGSAGYLDTINPDSSSTDFTDDLGVPTDDIAELEWLSNFVDDSFAEFPANSLTGTMDVRSETPLNSRSRSKRFRSTTTWTSAYESAKTQSSRTNCNDSNSKQKDQNSTVITSRERSTSSMETVPRKCTHCASEKTPQWRTGPLGPKTLCNACGVRYKSGRLVPEYRPAASPTFVLTQHSNSHRKVLELRRQKELLRQHQHQHQQQQQQHELYGHQHRHFQVC